MKLEPIAAFEGPLGSDVKDVFNAALKIVQNTTPITVVHNGRTFFVSDKSKLSGLMHDYFDRIEHK